jgi:hypothetical protein
MNLNKSVILLMGMLSVSLAIAGNDFEIRHTQETTKTLKAQYYAAQNNQVCNLQEDDKLLYGEIEKHQAMKLRVFPTNPEEIVYICIQAYYEGSKDDVLLGPIKNKNESSDRTPCVIDIFLPEGHKKTPGGRINPNSTGVCECVAADCGFETQP